MPGNQKPDKIKLIERWLHNYNQIVKTIKIDREYLNEAPLSGVSYDGISTSETYKIESQTENEALRRLKRETRLKQNIEIITNINEALSLLDPLDKEIITLYYIEGLSWFQVNYSVNLSVTQCRERRNKALVDIQEHIFFERYDYKTGCTQMALNL